MKRILAITIVVAICAGSADADGAAKPSPTVLKAHLTAEETLLYEFEGYFSFSSRADPDEYGMDPDSQFCEYHLTAQIQLHPQTAEPSGNMPVLASFKNANINTWRCENTAEGDVLRRLEKLEAEPVQFQVGPHRKVIFSHSTGDRPNRSTGVELLTKAVLDLLQTDFSNLPVSPGDSWRPSGQFFYWKEYADEGLEISAANMSYQREVEIAGDRCAQIDSKYIFSPLETPATAITKFGRQVANGSNAVSEGFHVSLLLDRDNQHIAWLNRSRRVDNRLLLHPTAQAATGEEFPPVTFRLIEQSTVRLIRKTAPVEWATAINKFEQGPQNEAEKQGPMPGDHSLADIARQARRQPTLKSVESEATDSITHVPAGFTLWENDLCANAWFCTRVSVFLPGTVKVLEQSLERVAYLSHVGAAAASTTVGPELDIHDRGLTVEEELANQTKYYIANRLWLAAGAGTSLKQLNTEIDGHPALVTDFTATRADSTSMQGSLAMLLTEWGKVVPVVCEYDGSDAAVIESGCRRAIASIRIKQIEHLRH